MIKYLQTLIWLTIFLTGCTGYNIEREGVYYKDWNEARGSAQTLLKDADPETFEILNNDDYGKDENLVFYQGTIIKGADPATFEFIDDLYAKDKFRAYYAGDSIESSSSKGFRIIDSYYSADDVDIFYTTKPLQVCKTKDFKIFDNKDKMNQSQRWETDGCYYYYMNFKIPSDDYKNVYLFKESAGFAKDKRWVYMGDRKINYNDDGKKIIDTVDVETFTVTNYIECRDKFGCINAFHGREKCK